MLMPSPVLALPWGSRSTTQRTEPLLGEAGPEVDRGGRLAHAAFLVRDGDDPWELPCRRRSLAGLDHPLGQGEVGRDIDARRAADGERARWCRCIPSRLLRDRWLIGHHMGRWRVGLGHHRGVLHRVGGRRLRVLG